MRYNLEILTKFYIVQYPEYRTCTCMYRIEHSSFCYFSSAAFKKIKRAVRFICTSQSVTRINPGTSRGGGWGGGGGRSNGHPIGFSDLKLESFKQSK